VLSRKRRKPESNLCSIRHIYLDSTHTGKINVMQKRYGASTKLYGKQAREDSSIKEGRKHQMEKTPSCLHRVFILCITLHQRPLPIVHPKYHTNQRAQLKNEATKYEPLFVLVIVIGAFSTRSHSLCRRKCGMGDAGFVNGFIFLQDLPYVWA